jgi:hypothetical protein
MTNKPKISTQAEIELEKSIKEVDSFNDSIKQLTLDRMNEAPKEELEPQTKMSTKEIDKSKEIYLKPERTISSADKFNEKYRSEYNFQKEYVHFVAENKEIIGECIEIWTKQFAGVPAELWKVPVNKPIWGPRYLAEQIARKFYHRMRSEEKTIIGADGLGSYTGSMVVDTTIPRLTAAPVSTRKSIFMGA